MMLVENLIMHNWNQTANTEFFSQDRDNLNIRLFFKIAISKLSRETEFQVTHFIVQYLCGFTSVKNLCVDAAIFPDKSIPARSLFFFLFCIRIIYHKVEERGRKVGRDVEHAINFIIIRSLNKYRVDSYVPSIFLPLVIFHSRHFSIAVYYKYTMFPH